MGANFLDPFMVTNQLSNFDPKNVCAITMNEGSIVLFRLKGLGSLNKDTEDVHYNSKCVLLYERYNLKHMLQFSRLNNNH